MRRSSRPGCRRRAPAAGRCCCASRMARPIRARSARRSWPTSTPSSSGRWAIRATRVPRPRAPGRCPRRGSRWHNERIPWPMEIAMRILNALVIAALGLGVAQAEERFPPPPVAVITAMSLDRPGALDALREANPGHYERAVAILGLASEMPCEGVPEVLRAQQLEATSIACRPSVIFTSWPAKREVSFALDGIRYTARVELRERERMEP